MSAIGIYNAVRRRTKKAFGFAVNLHRFRHAAASFWSIRDCNFGGTGPSRMNSSAPPLT